MNYLSNKLAHAFKHITLPENRRSSGINPSSASIQYTDETGRLKTVGGCVRQLYYKVTGAEKDSGGESNPDWIFAAIMGNSLHSLLCRLIDEYGFSMGIQRLAEEHAIYDEETGLSGRTDLLAWDYNRDEPIGVEIKSISEYKCKQAVEQPIEDHVLQSIIYLDYYNKNIPDDQKKITRWYLWYLARTENWTIKPKPHLSDLTLLWDFCIELDSDGVPIIHLPNGSSQSWSHFNISKIYKRYEELSEFVDKKVVPPRDYEVAYSEEKILALHKVDQIARKTDKTTIDRWVKKGCPPGKLKVSMGDGACMFCEYSKRCWEGVVSSDSKVFSNLPKVDKGSKLDKGNSDSVPLFL
jgi:hypothetical protein